MHLRWLASGVHYYVMIDLRYQGNVVGSEECDEIVVGASWTRGTTGTRGTAGTRGTGTREGGCQGRHKGQMRMTETIGRGKVGGEQKEDYQCQPPEERQGTPRTSGTYDERECRG